MRHPSITHRGAVTGVTGSCHKLYMDEGHALLVECGLFQGADTSPEGRAGTGNFAIDSPLYSTQALVVTHVHIDHVGRISYLLAAGFKGPILCSEPSAKLLPIVLEDAFKLGFSREQQQVERYLRLIEQRIVALSCNQCFNLIEARQLCVRIRLQQAGHILDSVCVEIGLVYSLGGEKERIVFSGNLGAVHATILPAPKPPCTAEILVIESAYGDRLHEDAARCQRLGSFLMYVLSNQGAVIIPAFSIGRIQELLCELEGIIYRRRLKVSPSRLDRGSLPIVLDLSLLSCFALIYRELDREAWPRPRKGCDPLASRHLLSVDSHQACLAMVNRLTLAAWLAIVIAGNGMCSIGRHNVRQAECTIGEFRAEWRLCEHQRGTL